MVLAKHERLRVLYLAKTSVGAPWAVRQVRDHVRLGIAAHVVVPAGGPRVAEYAAVGATVHTLVADLPVKRPWTMPGVFKEIRDVVARVDPDIIHLYHVGTAVAVRLALGKNHPIPRVFQVAGLLHLENPLSRRVEIATAGPRDYWIGVANAIERRYRAAGIPAARLFVADYGVDLDDARAHTKGVLRAELGVGPETKLVGMVGIMYPPKQYLGQRRGLKGHEDLIDALAIVMQERSDVMGVVIGGAWNDAMAYEKRVRAYGKARCGERIVFLGERADVPELLPDLDLAVQPSHTEGVAGTTKEALVSRVPVISTDVGGQADLIVHGETGWLVPAKEPRVMATAILEALHDPARAMAMAVKGERRVRTHFDGERNNAEVARIYATILASGQEATQGVGIGKSVRNCPESGRRRDANTLSRDPECVNLQTSRE